ncbi:MAG TPA: tyrosine-type recombinase/integrase, partial [Methylocella sp.]|nr:tyrosine-type recombinase/integrase [Methylocella sp.]
MLTLRSIASIRPGTVLWDNGKGSVTGFGARRQKGQVVAYCVKYRTIEGRQRWLTIGRHGAPWTADMARAEARRILSEVAKGNDPAGSKQEARKAATVAELCNDYFEAAEAGRILTRRKRSKRSSTLATDKSRIECHIKPLLGHLKVASVTRVDIERFRDAVTDGVTASSLARATGGIGAATRTLGLLGAIFSFAVRRGMRPDNPARGVERHADGQRQRRLSEAEYAALGEALRTMPANVWPIALAAAKFLALTGWRRGEMLTLKWDEVDLVTRTARLADTKTGASLRPLPHAACDVIRSIPRLGELVFPASTEGGKPMRGFHKVWLRIAAKAGLPDDVTPHTLRHSFASIAADLGFSELTI